MIDRSGLYRLTWRLPLLLWQGAFFVVPLCFMAAMTFWLVQNYRMEPAFVWTNWQRMLGRAVFWDAYWVTLWRAALAGLIASVVAFPASYVLAFRMGEAGRRFVLLCLIVPFFTSFLVRAYAWQVILAESGPVNAVLGGVGLGPFTMLNSSFGTMVGYLTLVLPLVVIFQTWSLAAIDRALIEAAWNLGATPVKTLLRVILPAARTGLLLGAVFAFIMSFGDFVSPAYLGGSKPPTLSILIIDTTKSGQQWPRAAVVSVMMIVTLFATAAAALRLAYGRRG
ncbi:ABC transporter permease [Frigidibacter sp.]|uniref:ABC transporter permease n=1 Tax=Frigidibacter sp. TaxID=2586418 RepID=UPI002733453E|nr:ABC transporter permease [Frigidibacter sp.]MDP3339339.1 ABC transporter permease [Frigidibacter sp.]